MVLGVRYVQHQFLRSEFSFFLALRSGWSLFTDFKNPWLWFLLGFLFLFLVFLFNVTVRTVYRFWQTRFSLPKFRLVTGACKGLQLACLSRWLCISDNINSWIESALAFQCIERVGAHVDRGWGFVRQWWKLRASSTCCSCCRLCGHRSICTGAFVDINISNTVAQTRSVILQQFFALLSSSLALKRFSILINLSLLLLFLFFLAIVCLFKVLIV